MCLSLFYRACRGRGALVWLLSPPPQEPRQRATIRDMPTPDATRPAVTPSVSGDAQGRQTSPRRARFVRGLRLGSPIFLGYVPVGMAFGVLAVQTGFTVGQAVACSATALAGAGQFIALSALTAGGAAASALVATAVVNLRYLLFSTTFAPHLRTARPLSRAWLAFTLTDETFAVNVADIRSGQATPASMAGVGAIAWSGWVAGTLVGAVGAGWIGDPTRWGVDFAMPAMFAALFVALAEDLRHVAVGLVAAALALVLPLASSVGLIIDSAWYVVIASMITATLATVMFRGD